MSLPLVVAKVGGSLFDLPDLSSRLRSLPNEFPESRLLLVPGGGHLADAIRSADAVHGIGEETSHWLALKTLSIQAEILAWMLPGWLIVSESGDENAILDPYTFAVRDEEGAGKLPHRWEVTTDSIALRVAQVSGAERLILLKSTNVQEGLSWEEASERGLVDRHFPGLLRRLPMAVEWRNWRRSASGVASAPGV